MKFLFKAIILVTICSITFQKLEAQTKARKPTKLTGYIYQTGGITIPFTYKVSYKIDDEGNYVTQCKVFIYGIYKYDVFGTHKKSQSKVKVEVDVAGGGLLAAVAEAQETTYSNPSLDHFGFAGVGRVLWGDNVPNQLDVKFLDKNFTYIKIFNVLGYHGDDGADYYVFR